MRWVLGLFWMTADQALASGMTHHGRLYGIPAWVARDPCDPNVLHGCAKVPLLSVVTILFDVFDDALCRVALPEGKIHVAPVRILRPIRSTEVRP